MKKIFIGIVVLLVITFGYLLFNRKSNEPISGEENKIYADLDGNGEKEYVALGMPEDEQENYLTSLVAYSKSGEEIASLPSDMTIKVPMSDSIKTHRLDKNNTTEVFSLEFIAGPHQSETMFFGLREDRILPICFKEIPEGPYDCLFYSGNVGYLPVEDLDGDGFIELIEVVDEYPSEGELSEEEKFAIDKAFEEEGVTEFTEGAEKIALREKGGRGRSVVWAIFSYNGKYFVSQSEDNYEKYYLLIGDLVNNKMRKSELSNYSLEYIQLVKEFWGSKEN
jgi:uncharacterized protein YxeA